MESDDDGTDDEIVCINGFDLVAPISLQVGDKNKLDRLSFQAHICLILVCKARTQILEYFQKVTFPKMSTCDYW